MLKFEGCKLPVSREILSEVDPCVFIGILHALRDTQEFLEHAFDAGHESEVFIAKPYSKDLEVISNIEELGLSVIQESYGVLEEEGYLEAVIKKYNKMLSNFLILDVGGYFAAPLLRLQEKDPDLLPQGVVEVTTFGHNRYQKVVSTLDVPVVSIARSPLKDVEAHYVGESSWYAIDYILRKEGLSPFGRKVGVVGHGMIGRRVANVARGNGAHTVVYDKDVLKLLDARSFKHDVSLSLESTLLRSDIVVCATGGQCISYEDILKAKDGIIFASAGSKVQEIDVENLRINAVRERVVSEYITEFLLINGKKVYVLRDGAAVNFVLGSCPDHTMDIVFAEIAASMQLILLGDVVNGIINEVDDEKRAEIAEKWLLLQM